MNEYWNIITSFAGIASALVALFVYFLYRTQRKESWLKYFNELHQFFWTDEDFKTVRSWLASDVKYEKELKNILEKRLKGRDYVSIEEYISLDKLDKFFNFLVRAKEVNPEFKKQRELWERLYFQYWFNEIALADRKYLWLYYQDNYKLVHKILFLEPNVDLSIDKMNSFINGCNTLRLSLTENKVAT
jgi:hypothetical protein